MKIAFVLSNCTMSGSSRNVLEIGKYFTEWGHEVHIFANSCDPLGENMYFHKIPALSSTYVVREGSITLFETLIMKLKKFDITIAQQGRYFSPDICHVRILNKLALKSLKETTGSETLGAKVSTWPEEYGLKKSKHIIAMSNALKKDILENYDIPENKITVVYDGVSLEQFDIEKKKDYRQEIRKRFGIPEKNVVIIFAGNPFSRKGLEYLIRALPLIKNKNTKLIVLGRDNIGPYMEIAKSLGVDKNIINAGFTKEIQKFFAAGDMFVFPTLYEAFGLVITEAMASGLPVITTTSAGAAELIEDGKEGFLLKDPKDHEAIASYINSLMENKLFEKFGTAARKKIEKYTWEKTAKEMMNVFERFRR